MHPIRNPGLCPETHKDMKSFKFCEVNILHLSITTLSKEMEA